MQATFFDGGKGIKGHPFKAVFEMMSEPLFR